MHWCLSIMHTTIRPLVVLSSLVGLFFTQSASAQNYPGTHPHDVLEEQHKSKIDGQLVKVGEKNQYLYTYPKLNISTNPFSPLLNRLSVSVTYALTMNLAVRGDVSVFLGDDYDGSAAMGSGINATLALPLYFKKVYSGFFIEPGVQVGEFDREDLMGFQVAAGWHWMWDSALNVSAGAGIGRNFASGGDCQTDEWATYCDDPEEIYPVAYFRVGYAF